MKFSSADPWLLTGLVQAIGSSPSLGVTEAALICDQEVFRQFIATSPLSLELVYIQLFFDRVMFLSKHKKLSRREKKMELLFEEIRLRKKTQKCLFI